jgi:spermidine synthase
MGNVQTYFTEGSIVAESGDVKVYFMQGQLFLEIGPGHDLWALESEDFDYINQLKDLPKGNCLEIGLGLGVASRCIMTYPMVDHLTTVEKNKDIIETHKQIIPLLDKKPKKWLKYNSDMHTIIHEEGLRYLWNTTEEYDFIFMDFYKGIDEDSMPEIADMVKAAHSCLAPGGIIRGWFDPYTPMEFVEPFYNLFRKLEEDDE